MNFLLFEITNISARNTSRNPRTEIRLNLIEFAIVCGTWFQFDEILIVKGSHCVRCLIVGVILAREQYKHYV